MEESLENAGFLRGGEQGAEVEMKGLEGKNSMLSSGIDGTLSTAGGSSAHFMQLLNQLTRGQPYGSAQGT